MARGDSSLGGGRPKGTRNRVASAQCEAAPAAGETPLDYMLRVMRDANAGDDRRDKMAVAVVPYLHARLASMEHKGDGGGAITIEIVKFDPASQ